MSSRGLFYPILWFISVLYRITVWFRNRLFDRGWLPVTRFDIPVISIGNITAGGTGKTPFTIWLTEHLRSDFDVTTIVSRGYRRRTTGERVVSDGKGRILDAQSGGDEPVLMAKRLAGIPVIVAEQRRAGIQMAIEKFGPGLIIMDDAFQHRYVARDCDAVLIDRRKDIRKDKLLPAGFLREPLKNLQRADVIVYTHCELPPSPGETPDLGKYYDGPVVYTTHMPDFFVDRQMKKYGGSESLMGKPVGAFAGIADPDGFRHTLEKLGLEVKKFSPLPDHHSYTGEWLGAFCDDAKRLGCTYVVTTEKDLVKLPERFDGGVKLLALRLRIYVHEPEKVLQSIRRHIDIGVIRA